MKRKNTENGEMLSRCTKTETVSKSYYRDTVDGSEILHQLRLVVYPIIYRDSGIPGGFSRRISEPSTVSRFLFNHLALYFF